MPRAPSSLAGLVFVAATAGAATARAEPPAAPVFEGHPDLVTRTKEVSVEGSYSRLGDGRSTVSGGAAVATFYTPWLSLLGGANFSPGFFAARQHYDTRAVVRLVWPEPLVGHLFAYVGGGVNVFFFEDEVDSERYRRAFGAVGAIGVFQQLSGKFRLRLEARDHWLLAGGAGMRHNVFVSLSLVTLYR
ncbi:MAG: hypothetical protein HYV09_12035, partial [Deltaproteobacteria bacterium]|nr:hypothetical protein [Deltaproteobacteria bacterium]